MRLRQLSRKLDIDTEKVIHFLKVSNLPCEDDSNAKLSDEQVELLIQKFGPIEEITPEETETIIEPVEAQVAEEKEIVTEEEQVVAEEIENSHDQLSEVISTLLHKQEEPLAEPEVIRAPKVELTGLKVVGKIELRTPKKKEETEEESSLEENGDQPKISKSRSPIGKYKERQHPHKKTLSLADQRKREEKRNQRKKREAEELAKKKKKENYLKKVKAKGKEKLEVKKPKVELSEKTSTRHASKNVGLFTKFFNWMRRE